MSDEVRNKDTYAKLMQISEMGNNVNIYYKKGKDDSMAVMVNTSKEETVLIVFKGTFSRQNFFNMLKTEK